MVMMFAPSRISEKRYGARIILTAESESRRLCAAPEAADHLPDRLCEEGVIPVERAL